ncbi:MAG: anaerobic ribonucleoside-triphosphate reductase activating protein [Clostridiaceae bacterium]|nr:anaerobic ribonucleoside-triphosphate reductase activating protein [Clostridiaceae bacterium]
MRVAGIVSDSITDGPGLRLTLFVQGCERNCQGCHNQSYLPMDGGNLYTTQEIMDIIRRNPILSGVTFSGGEPMLQAEALLPLARMIKEAGFDLAIYTGYTFEELIDNGNTSVLELLSLADTLIDGPFILAKKSLKLSFRGSTNQRILNLRDSMKQGIAVVEQSSAWNGAYDAY